MPRDEGAPVRDKLPVERAGLVRRFHIVYFEDDEVTGKQVRRDLKFYIQPGLYPDGRLGEILIKGEKQGGMISGALDAMATMISISLQHGVPLASLTCKLRGCMFGPSGLTGDQEFPRCTSMFDLIAQYLDKRFPDGKYVGQKELLYGKPTDQGEVPERQGDQSNGKGTAV